MEGGPDKQRLGELARLFLKLVTFAFGGPAAQVAMMEDVVGAALARNADRTLPRKAEGTPRLLAGFTCATIARSLAANNAA